MIFLKLFSKVLNMRKGFSHASDNNPLSRTTAFANARIRLDIDLFARLLVYNLFQWDQILSGHLHSLTSVILTFIAALIPQRTIRSQEWGMH